MTMNYRLNAWFQLLLDDGLAPTEDDLEKAIIIALKNIGIVPQAAVVFKVILPFGG